MESQVFSIHANEVIDVAFRPGTLDFASAALDNMIKFTGIKTQPEFGGMRLDKKPTCIGFSKSGRVFALAEDSGDVYVYDMILRKSMWKRSFPTQSSSATKLTFFSDEFLATGHGDGWIRIWHINTGKLLQEILGQPNTVTGVGFSPDGATVCASYYSGYPLVVWNWQAESNITNIRPHYVEHDDFQPNVWCAIMHPSEPWILTAADDQTIGLWEITSGDCIRMFRGHTDSPLDLAFCTDGSFFASAGNDNTIRVWDTSIPYEVAVYDPADNEGEDRFYCISYSSDGNYVVAGNSNYSITVLHVEKIHQG